MNETISIYKEKKSSDLEKAVEKGADRLVEEFRNSNKTFDQLFHRTKFKTKKELAGPMSIIIVNSVIAELQKLCPPSNAMTVISTESKSKLAENKGKYTNYFNFKRNLQEIQPGSRLIYSFAH